MCKLYDIESCLMTLQVGFGPSTPHFFSFFLCLLKIYLFQARYTCSVVIDNQIPYSCHNLLNY